VRITAAAQRHRDPAATYGPSTMTRDLVDVVCRGRTRSRTPSSAAIEPQNLRSGKFSQPAQGPPNRRGRLGSGDEGAVASIGGFNAARQCPWPKRCWEESDCDRPELLPGTIAARDQPICFGVHLGWADIATAAPIAERAATGPQPSPTARTPWSHKRNWAAYIFPRERPWTISHGPSSKLALQLNPNFSLAPGPITAWLCPIAGRWQEAYEATQRAIRLKAPREPLFGDLLRRRRLPPSFVGKKLCPRRSLFSREAIRERGDLTGALPGF